MKRVLLILTGIWAGFVSTLGAQTEESVDRLLKVTGVIDQVSQTMESMGPQFESLKPMIQGTQQKLVIRALVESFTAAPMLAAKRDLLLKSGRQDYVDRILKIYEDPLMLKITRMEIDAGTPENRKLQTQPLALTPARQALIKKFIQDSRFVEQTVETVDGIFDGFLLALEAADQTQFDRAKKTFDLMKPMMTQNLTSEKQMEVFLNLFGHIYSQATDQELQKYFDFIATEEGRWFSEILFQGTKEGYQRCARAAGALILKGKAPTDEI